MKRAIFLLNVTMHLTVIHCFAQGNFGKEYSYSMNSVLVAANGNYITTGINNFNLAVVCLQPSGTVVWSKEIDLQLNNGWQKPIVETDDHDFIIADTRLDTASNVYEPAILKIDSNGNLLWAKSLGCTAVSSNLVKMIRTSDHNNVLIAYQNSPYAFIVKFDDDGNILWSKLTSNPSINLYDIYAAEQGSFLLSTVSSFDCFVIKFDVDGNILWQQGYQFPGLISRMYDMKFTPAYKYIMCGASANATTQNIFLFETDNAGTLNSAYVYSFEDTSVINAVEAILTQNKILIAVNRFDGYPLLMQINFLFSVDWINRTNFLSSGTFDQSIDQSNGSTILTLNQNGTMPGLILKFDTTLISSGCADSFPAVVSSPAFTTSTGAYVTLDTACTLEDFAPIVTDFTVSSQSVCSFPTLSTVIQTPSLNIYPNPATDEIHISTSDLPGNVLIRLVNAYGRVVRNDQWFNTQTNGHTLNIKNLPSGMYTVLMSNDNVYREGIFIKD